MINFDDKAKTLLAFFTKIHGYWFSAEDETILVATLRETYFAGQSDGLSQAIKVLQGNKNGK